MKKTVIFFLLLSFALFGLDKLGLLAAPKGVIEQILSFRIRWPQFNNSQELKNLREEKIRLLSLLVDQQNLLNENQALRIQLGVKGESHIFNNKNLLPAKVLGVNLDYMIIDIGEKDHVGSGQTVVYKNILIGKVVETSTNRSRVELVTQVNKKILGKTQKGALGIINVQSGGGQVLENVTLKEPLEAGDLVLTQADEFPPDLLIGEVTTVLRQESALFQKAQIKSPISVKQLDMVFIIL